MATLDDINSNSDSYPHFPQGRCRRQKKMIFVSEASLSEAEKVNVDSCDTCLNSLIFSKVIIIIFVVILLFGSSLFLFYSKLWFINLSLITEVCILYSSNILHGVKCLSCGLEEYPLDYYHLRNRRLKMMLLW